MRRIICDLKESHMQNKIKFALATFLLSFATVSRGEDLSPSKPANQYLGGLLDHFEAEVKTWASPDSTLNGLGSPADDLRNEITGTALEKNTSEEDRLAVLLRLETVIARSLKEKSLNRGDVDLFVNTFRAIGERSQDL